MTRLLATLLVLLTALPALAQGTAPAAKVPALGEELTAFGAVRAGNPERSIPAWTGGLTQMPPGVRPGGHLTDPYIEDERWFTVGVADIDRYKFRLSAGLQAMLRKHPSFEVPIYPTHRSAAAPQEIYDASLANAKTATMAENGLAVRGARVGVPFPIPANGLEAMWNHVLRWQGVAMRRDSVTVLPELTGALPTTTYREERLSPYAAGQDGRPVYYRRTALSGDKAGTTLLLRRTLDPIRTDYSNWYREGEAGRVVRAPGFAYDTPDPATGGICTADMLDMFSGPMDRFNFRLITRRGMYVPYNAYRLTLDHLAPADFLWPSHPNPQFLRYELHRVWVVEATLKPGFRHAFPERTYYLDEDSWQILMADHYDAKGDLVRYAEAHGIEYPQVPVFAPVMEVTYDLSGDRYVVTGINNAFPPPDFQAPLTAKDFEPDALETKKRW